MTKNVLAWIGDGAPRMEVAHVAQIDPTLRLRARRLGRPMSCATCWGQKRSAWSFVGLSIVERGRWDGDQVVVPCGLGRVDLCG